MPASIFLQAWPQVPNVLAPPAGSGIGGALATAMAEPQSPANQQTALRLAANSFAQPPLRQWVAAQVAQLL